MTPEQQFIVALAGLLATSLTAIIVNTMQVRSLRKHVNSRMDQLISLQARASLAEGKALGPDAPA